MFHGRIEPRMIQNDYLGLNMGPHLNDVFSGICVDFSGYPWVSFFSDRRQDFASAGSYLVGFSSRDLHKSAQSLDTHLILLHLWRFFQSFHTESSIRDGDLAHSI